MSRQPIRLTTRGRVVVWGGVFVASLLLGFLTADWCWYGYCGA